MLYIFAIDLSWPVVVLAAATSANNVSGNSWYVGLPWYAQVIGGIIAVVFTAWLGYLFTKRLPSERIPAAALEFSTIYCRDLLTPTAFGVKDQLQVLYQGQMLARPVLIYFVIRSVGNIPAKDVNIKVQAANGDCILRHQFSVTSSIQCQRLVPGVVTPQSLRYRCTFMNPGDSMMLMVLVTPCGDPRCVSLEIDAEGVTVTPLGIQEDCQLSNPQYPSCGACA